MATNQKPLTLEEIKAAVDDAVSPEELVVRDIHTHLFPQVAGDSLALRGLVELLRYHYISRELLSGRHIGKQDYNQLSPLEQAKVAWKCLFIDRIPVSEGCLGVLTVIKALGLDPNEPDLEKLIAQYNKMPFEERHKQVLAIAGVSEVIGTNDPFNATERAFYEQGPEVWPETYSCALRLDELVLHFKRAVKKLQEELGYDGVTTNLDSEENVAQLQKFLHEWIEKLPRVRYVASSFPPDCDVSDVNSEIGMILDKVVLPVCKEAGLPFFMMPGPLRAENPEFGNGGDGAGLCDWRPYQRLVQRHRDLMFWITPLHFGNQFDASVLTCNSENVMVWGFWWFCLQPSMTEDILRMRFEMNGGNFFPFNSDSRVLENLISKWLRFREILAKVLTEKYEEVAALGREVTREMIDRDLESLFDPDRLTGAPFPD